MNSFEMEWILSNKNGTYSASTVSMANTRTYHGIYVKAINENYDRINYLNKFFEVLRINNELYNLDTNFYDVVYPDGYKFLESFNDYGYLEFIYKIRSSIIYKRMFLDDYDTLIIEYDSNGVDEFLLYPLISFRRSYLTLNHNNFNVSINKYYEFSSGDYYFNIDIPGDYIEENKWYYNFNYPVDMERGSNYIENLFLPGHFSVKMNKFTVRIFIDRPSDTSIKKIKKKQGIAAKASKFIVKNNILAGFYWFGPWGRDTFISMPGILLTQRRFNDARNILIEYSNRIKNGMVPRIFTPDYESGDTGLWFIYAFYKYYNYTMDNSILEFMYKKMVDIVNSYINGNDLYYLDNYLVTMKRPKLTWMDAQTGDKIFTPRTGKPVEINALWYNALRSMSYFSELLHIKNDYDGIAEMVSREFKKTFISKHFIMDTDNDPSVRPNMIFSFSLPYNILDNFNDYKEIIDDELLTPYGLRSLSKYDRNYHGFYTGDQYSRDSAYHNGAIWTWLAGPYITASVRSGHDRKELYNYFKNLYSLYMIPELFDDTLKPKGCVMQAWSYGELLRAYHEDLVGQ
ncbi:amylo-alpha-1,6-glucosidase [Picrophilus oshimae]|nr:amylo-alpha-1,6-glucosidase [Picrophilus oshimae]